MILGRDGVAGLICLVISLVLLAQSFGLPQMPMVPVGPGFYPRIVLSFMAAMSVLMIAQDWRNRRVAAREDKPAGARPAYGLVLAVFGAVGVYILLLPMLGFRIATVMFVAGLQWVLERPKNLRQWLVLGAIAIGAAVLTHLIFEKYLMVLLPRGSWANW